MHEHGHQHDRMAAKHEAVREQGWRNLCECSVYLDVRGSCGCAMRWSGDSDIFVEWHWVDGAGVATERELLIDAGRCVRQDGRTPLDIATEKRQDAVAAMLREVRGL